MRQCLPRSIEHRVQFVVFFSECFGVHISLVGQESLGGFLALLPCDPVGGVFPALFEQILEDSGFVTIGNERTFFHSEVNPVTMELENHHRTLVVRVHPQPANRRNVRGFQGDELGSLGLRCDADLVASLD